jgi:hypothetical protein
MELKEYLNLKHRYDHPYSQERFTKVLLALVFTAYEKITFNLH